MGLSAQSDYCSTPEDNDPDPAGQYSYKTSLQEISSNDVVVFNIFFWGINRSDGTSDYPLTEEDTLGAVARLNKSLNQFNIFFKYYGFDTFNASAYYVNQAMGSLINYATDNGYRNYEAFNVYVPYEHLPGSGQAWSQSTISVMDSDHLNSPTFVHEIGHNLGLLHTFSGYLSNGCERVTRDPNDPVYNADTKGDKVTDTGAVPWFNRNGIINLDVTTCEYFGDDTDCGGTPYDISINDSTNFMGYNGSNDCRTYFSPGQGVRMRETIEGQYSFRFDPTITTIESLYHPYKGQYYFAGPNLPVEDQPHLQPGFDYTFVSCCCGYLEPSDYEDTSFTTNNNYESYSYDVDYVDPIIHQNHYAIIIDQIDPNQARRCQDNYNRTPVGGKVTRFNDGVFNYNITEDPKDSTGINSPTLVNDLDPGLYKIEKNLNGGYIEEEVIQKNN